MPSSIQRRRRRGGGLRARSIVFDTVAVTSWRSQAVAERTSLAFLTVGAVISLPAFVVVAAVDSSPWPGEVVVHRHSRHLTGGPVDLLSLAATILVVGVAVIGAGVLAKHLERHRASTRAALLAAIVLLVSVVLVESALVVAALRSAS